MIVLAQPYRTHTLHEHERRHSEFYWHAASAPTRTRSCAASCRVPRISHFAVRIEAALYGSKDSARNG